MSDNTKCDQCGGVLAVSTAFIAGHTVIGCVACNRFRFDGQDEWISGGPDAVERLKAKTGVADEEAQKTGVIDTIAAPDA